MRGGDGLKFPQRCVEWWERKQLPFIGLHPFTNLSPPLIRIFYQPVPKCRLIKNPASPRGKPRGRNRKRFMTNAPRCPGSFGSPARRPLQWLCKTIVYYHPTGYTPSASRSFGSSLREGAKAALPQREAKSLPYGCGINRKGIPFSRPLRCVSFGAVL